MPTEQEHIRKKDGAELARSDLQSSKNSAQHADWIVTISFYKALHAVDAYLGRKGIHPESHTTTPPARNELVRQHLGQQLEKKFFIKYKALYTASQRARYQKESFEDNQRDFLRAIKNSDEIVNCIDGLLQNPRR